MTYLKRNLFLLSSITSQCNWLEHQAKYTQNLINITSASETIGRAYEKQWHEQIVATAMSGKKFCALVETDSEMKKRQSCYLLYLRAKQVVSGSACSDNTSIPPQKWKKLLVSGLQSSRGILKEIDTLLETSNYTIHINEIEKTCKK